MSQIKIKSIVHKNMVSQRTGNPYESCNIISVSKDGTDIKLRGFGSEITKTWRSGDTIDVDITQTDKGYWNFKENENSKASPDMVVELLNVINKKLDILISKKTDVSTGAEFEKEQMDSVADPF